MAENTATMAPGRRTATGSASSPAKRRDRRYNVVLLDDDDHTYDYVIGMLRKAFGFETEKAYELACEVDTAGRVILLTTTLEHAELKRDQIRTFGRDWRLPRCQGSMSAIIEPVDS